MSFEKFRFFSPRSIFHIFLAKKFTQVKNLSCVILIFTQDLYVFFCSWYPSSMSSMTSMGAVGACVACSSEANKRDEKVGIPSCFQRQPFFAGRDQKSFVLFWLFYILMTAWFSFCVPMTQGFRLSFDKQVACDALRQREPRCNMEVFQWAFYGKKRQSDMYKWIFPHC